MKVKHIALAVALLPLASSAFAEVTLQLPDNVRLLAVNEQDPSKNITDIFFATDDKLTFNNGENQIVYQIDQYFYKGDKQSERFRSSPYILTFSAENSSLQLEIPNFRRVEQANEFNYSPTVNVQTTAGKNIPFKHDKLELKGLSISHDYHEYVKQYNKLGGPAALATATATATAVTHKVEPAPKQSKTNVSTQSEAPIKQQLQTLFNQADKETKKEFISWAVQNL
ncbi:hypothetical protein AB733_07545 [Photobacterium swingsii]|uniref:UPF0319 protein C9I94_11730 n=1 Tax=Photobacterium swingsii TaxID=680026 RepID=A0A0J8VCX9_9GAMM|nr:DUF2057 domain-containing protein [Photobacterium swingsii]KMV31338.1 hypothetical protein AB733_07545 [Photobacterium swingsii]PSW24006.1 DUF2057 domain-containing protein [Photobacterium swingsii]